MMDGKSNGKCRCQDDAGLADDFQKKRIVGAG